MRAFFGFDVFCRFLALAGRIDVFRCQRFALPVESLCAVVVAGPPAERAGIAEDQTAALDPVQRVPVLLARTVSMRLAVVDGMPVGQRGMPCRLKLRNDLV
ncbi:MULTISPECIES: hypothetical protein [Paraburkholderia]|uniref:hypothetical protein n=1 Tax=Paraburkholderia TaxID=1822464 RepID=UPI003218B8BF